MKFDKYGLRTSFSLDILEVSLSRGLAKVSRVWTIILRILSFTLASCLINAQPLPPHRPVADDNEMGSCPVVVWVRSFIKPDLFDNNVPFDNTTPIYLINLLWKLGL